MIWKTECVNAKNTSSKSDAFDDDDDDDEAAAVAAVAVIVVIDRERKCEYK